MRKIIATMNMTLDGYCDHTYGIADAELHEHFSQVLQQAGVLLYGRKTFELMEYWQEVLAKPTGEKAMDDFAQLMDRTPKLVFSHTLKGTNWHSARLAERSLEEEIQDLQQQEGKDIYVGSPGLIATLTQKGLVDEWQLCVHPVIAGSGLVLFKDITAPITLKRFDLKTFGSGTVVLYYKRA